MIIIISAILYLFTYMYILNVYLHVYFTCTYVYFLHILYI